MKLTFFKGASLQDPSGLFNSSLEGNTRRAIDFHENDEIDEKAFVTLIRAAVTLNASSPASSIVWTRLRGCEAGLQRQRCSLCRGIATAVGNSSNSPMRRHGGDEVRLGSGAGVGSGVGV